MGDIEGNLGYTLEDVVDGKFMFPRQPVPVYAMIDGVKTCVGRGIVNPDTLVFTTTMDRTPEGRMTLETLRALDRDDVGFVSIAGAVLKDPVHEGPTTAEIIFPEED